MGKEIKGVIITRVKKDGLDMPYLNVKGMLELPVLGIVPEDKTIRKALTMKDAVMHTHPNSPASKAYRMIAAKLSGIEYREPSMYERFLSFLGMKA